MFAGKVLLQFSGLKLRRATITNIDIITTMKNKMESTPIIKVAE